MPISDPTGVLERIKQSSFWQQIEADDQKTKQRKRQQLFDDRAAIDAREAREGVAHDKAIAAAGKKLEQSLAIARRDDVAYQQAKREKQSAAVQRTHERAVVDRAIEASADPAIAAFVVDVARVYDTERYNIQSTRSGRTRIAAIAHALRAARELVFNRTADVHETLVTLRATIPVAAADEQPAERERLTVLPDVRDQRRRPLATVATIERQTQEHDARIATIISDHVA